MFLVNNASATTLEDLVLIVWIYCAFHQSSCDTPKLQMVHSVN